MSGSAPTHLHGYPAKLDHIPREILSAQDYERVAQQFLPEPIWAYITGGSGADLGVSRNRKALQRWQIQPRVLVDMSSASSDLTLFGQGYSHPFILGPLAYQTLVHPAGEVATAQGAAALDACMTISTLSGIALESIVSAADRTWFQLYCQPQWQDTISLLARAEAAGCQAIVVTVDVPVQAMRYSIQRSGFALPKGVVAANLSSFSPSSVSNLPEDSSPVFQGVMAGAPTWETIARLRDETRLPLLIKGILHPEDAIKAKSIGIDGVVVSNHGGRALDDYPAALDCLPAIRSAVGREFTLLCDSGIRSGSDAFKALALGANAVMLGRPQVYALSVAGALGVAHLLRTLVEELHVVMSLAGTPKLTEISPERVLRAEHPC